MHLPGRRSFQIGALILGIVALASCSTLPTAPPSPTQNQVIITRVGDEPEEAPHLASLVGSKLIDGRLGGVLVVGRWKVVVPRQAYNGIGTITISVPDTTVDNCDLSIDPPTLNHFAEDVELRYRCKTLVEAERRDMRWWNPNTNGWVVIKSWPNTSDVTRCAPLQHFSRYASGKAGW